MLNDGKNTLSMRQYMRRLGSVHFILGGGTRCYVGGAMGGWEKKDCSAKSDEKNSLMFSKL